MELFEGVRRSGRFADNPSAVGLLLAEEPYSRV
jgi:hypothetical protein